MLRLVQLAKGFSDTKTSQELVEFQNFGKFGKVVLNRPKSLNALDKGILDKLIATIPNIQKTKAYWIEGAGGKAFCAGGDLKNIYLNKQNEIDFFRTLFDCNQKISKMKSIQIANWDGIVIGGGVGISIFAPFRIATQRTILILPQNKIGFFIDEAASGPLAKLRNKLGYYIGVTGIPLRGEDVYNCGLANFYVLSRNIPKIYQEIKNQVLNSLNPQKTIKEIIVKYSEKTHPSLLKNEEQIKNLFDVDNVVELLNKLQSNSNNPLHKEILKALSTQSPLSTHITFQNIKNAEHRSFQQNFSQYFRIVCSYLKRSQFYEGIKVLLIDKKSKPNWTYKSVRDVPRTQVEKYISLEESQPNSSTNA